MQFFYLEGGFKNGTSYCCSKPKGWGWENNFHSKLELSDEEILGVLSGKLIKVSPGSKTTLTPFKTVFRAAEKQFKKVDQDKIQNIDQDVLEKVVIDAVEDYLSNLN